MILRTMQFPLILIAALALLQACAGAQTPAPTQTSSYLSQEASRLAENWRDIKEGVDGYPAGPMLEIALRRTHSDKLEMFKWRSEFISKLSAQPGPLVEREWRSLSGVPANTGAGTWTGMTWWENQQRWHDMANTVFPSPVTNNWLQTINMTLIFVKPIDEDFDLRTLAQSGEEVLEMGLLVFPTRDPSNSEMVGDSAEQYLDILESNGAHTYRFEVYPNPSGFYGPYTTAYNKNGPPATEGEEWFVYMASYESLDVRDSIQGKQEVKETIGALTDALVNEHSEIQVMTKTTSKVCCKASNMCSLDPDECKVGILGYGDTWAGSCNECPQPCVTGYNVCSNLSPQTCQAVGGELVSVCP